MRRPPSACRLPLAGPPLPETDVGYVVQLPELLHHHLADLPARYLGQPLLVERRLDAVYRRLQRPHRQGALLAGLAYPQEQLLAGELLAAAVLLHHQQARHLGALLGGEALAPGDALAAAADAVLGVPRVDHLRVFKAAVGAAHS